MTILSRMILVVGCCCAAVSGAALKYPMEGNLGGVESPYTEPILKLLKEWKNRSRWNYKGENPVELLCYETPVGNLYIGAEQHMWINAPIKNVKAVVDDIDHYKEYFPDYEETKLVEKDGNKLLTYWEQKVPIPFVPNVKYEMLYFVDDSHPERVVYRYQLKKKGQLNFSDGIIFMEKEQDDKTRYTEFDFWDADYGIAKSFGSEKIWRDSIEGLYLSDVGVKLKAENMSWDYPKVVSAEKEVLKKFPTDDCVKNRKPSPFVKAAPAAAVK